MISLTDSRDRVNNFLTKYLDNKISESAKIHPSYARLYEEVKRVSLAGGKRLRPHLTYVGAGGHSEAADAVAAAHELLHIALLIHDDIIDRDQVRHNQPSIHGQYQKLHYLSAIEDEQERLHFSQSAALLGGDLLISGAYEIIHQADVSFEQLKKLQKLITTSIFEVAAGELLDTEAPFMNEQLDPILVYRYKTASYSTIAPLLSGVVLREGISSEDVVHLSDYAKFMGIAYQMQDDTLGVFGDSEVTGKSTLGDLREGKQTYLISCFRSLANDEAIKCFNINFGNDEASEDELNNLKTHISSSGALKAAQDKEAEFMNLALAAANKISIPNLRANLTDLSNLLNKRGA